MSGNDLKVFNANITISINVTAENAEHVRLAVENRLGALRTNAYMTIAPAQECNCEDAEYSTVRILNVRKLCTRAYAREVLDSSTID
jgi:hypothetical protein